jgi:hypothetical protein
MEKWSFAVGFEPTFSAIFKVSLMLIFAFLCANLHTKLREFTSYFKDYFASLCIDGQKNVCGTVQLCGNCAGAEFCAGFVRALSTATSQSTPQKTHCMRWVWLVAVLVAGAMVAGGLNLCRRVRRDCRPFLAPFAIQSLALVLLATLARVNFGGANRIEGLILGAGGSTSSARSN